MQSTDASALLVAVHGLHPAPSPARPPAGPPLSREGRAWLGACGLLALALFTGAWLLRRSGSLPAYERPGLDLALAEAVGLAALAAIAALAHKPLLGPLAGGDLPGARELRARRPYWTLFIVSFAALFVELMLIRYCTSQIRIFSFYKNVPLIGCYLGLGLGCCLSRGTSRHAFSFLVWTVPLGVLFAAGSSVAGNTLGVLAATASSEQILGDFIPAPAGLGGEILSQVLMASFCVVTFVVITLLFSLLGRLLGDAFEGVPRLPGYTINILGSLAGILAFSGLSYLETPPYVWFAVGLLPLAWWLPGRRLLAIGLAALSAAAVFPSYGDTVWSRYQKLVGHALAPSLPNGPYLVQISDVFYQIAVDRSPEGLARAGADPYPHYDAMFRRAANPKRVLVVGAGTGNDVAAALRAGAGSVHAVEIDPDIVRFGRERHPNHPYSSDKVRVTVDDARHAFRTLPPRLLRRRGLRAPRLPHPARHVEPASRQLRLHPGEPERRRASACVPAVT